MLDSNNDSNEKIKFMADKTDPYGSKADENKEVGYINGKINIDVKIARYFGLINKPFWLLLIRHPPTSCCCDLTKFRVSSEKPSGMLARHHAFDHSYESTLTRGRFRSIKQSFFVFWSAHLSNQHRCSSGWCGLLMLRPGRLT